jgi:DNA-binding NarL/FixJ family response regulator
MSMIAPLENSGSDQKTAFVHSQFLAMLPQIRRQAEVALRFCQSEAREEFVAEVIALAYRAWVRLVDQGREQIARPTPLAQYALRQVRAGRRLGCRQHVQELLSDYARQTHGFTVERIDRPEVRLGGWRQILVEDHRAGPAETAAARLDVAAWLRTLSTRNRRIAKALALGNTTSAVAQKFGLSAGRVSQLRNWLWLHWQRFQSGPATATCSR